MLRTLILVALAAAPAVDAWATMPLSITAPTTRAAAAVALRPARGSFAGVQLAPALPTGGGARREGGGAVDG
ncbi:hypothetical protein T484DRAFT_1809890 [Baffinella frigidus]|nr:hypothetical protein T484DRAFT_1809890 [Cryptophyta sp. CCMP2293]